ncbi:LPXTG cell wall anchor domain-containing protein [Aerococcus sp. UMB7834]|uniref:collagen-flanked surface repeat-containing protein n=1 Tax=Aerococcus sp. UMB7834 TaxID=3046342 RepID=UPI00254B4A34|nr:LPXTG cell wall anchor domain-containing protein [Aerococcus sp. UMB7834]MDK6805023.1 LPXTG cell wall anchor domain-containing protein [Aerococcus sp. UMB7834]
MRGQYWREVSREVVQEAQSQIFGYNFESIIRTEPQADGGVKIVYNTGRELVIPGPKQPDKPLLPNKPIVEVNRGQGSHPESGKHVKGSYVTVKIYNPNTDQFEDEKTIFIPDGEKGDQGERGEQGLPGTPGQDGTDGKDGKSVLATTERGTKADETGKERPGTWMIVHEDANNNGKVDPGEREISREFIFDGTDGKNGKTPVVESERVEKDPNDPNSESGVKIIVRDPESNDIIKETFVKDGEKGEKGDQGEPGQDGKSSYVHLVKGPNEAGDPGQWLITYFDKNGDGKFTEDEIVSTEFVADGKDGKDGKSVLATTERGTEVDENGQNCPGTWVIVHEDTNNNGQVDPGEREISREFIFDGTDGKNGKSPVVESERVEKDPNDPNSESGVKIIVRDPESNDIIKETFVKDGEKGEKGDQGTPGTPGQDGQDGKDGKSVLATAERGTKTDENGKDRPGTWMIVHEDANNNGKVDPGEREISREFIFDGTDGKNGKTPVVESERVEKDPNDPNSESGVKIIVRDPENNEVIKETFVKDGEKGEKGDQGEPGQDGKSSYVHVVKGPNEAGESGNWIITYFDKNGDGKFTEDEIVSSEFVADGKDGKSPKAEVKDNGNGTHTVTITNPDGTTTETVIEDGKDGKSATAEVKDNNDGTHTITITNPDGSQTTTVVRNGEKGDKGDPGKDGNSSYVHLVKGPNEAGDPGQWIITYFDKNGDGKFTEDEIVSSEFVADGKDGAPGQAGAKGDKGDPGQAGKDGKSSYVHLVKGPNEAGQPGQWIITYFDKNGDGKFTEDEIVSSEFVADGKDGKSPKAEVKNNGNGTHTVIITNPDGTKSETIIKDGKDGKAATAEVKDNGDGSHTIITTNPDGSQTTTVVKNGKDGKSSYVHLVKGPNEAGEPGQWIITYFDKNGDGKFTEDEIVSSEFVADGKDGKSPKAEVKNNGNGTHTVTITNPDGTKSETVIKDGKDGKSATAEVIDNGNGTHTITITNPDGSQTTTVVKDGAKGDPGQDGKDGKSVTVSTEPGHFQGQDGVWIIVQDSETGKELDRDFVANGKDGKDGKSADIKTEALVDPNGQETGYKITIIHPDGLEETRLIKHGKDGKDGKDGRDGKSIIATTERGDHKGQSGAWLIIRDRETLQEIDREFIADGQNGKSADISSRETTEGLEITIHHANGTSHTHIIRDGKDGKSITASTEPGSFNGQSGMWLIIRDRDTGQELDRQFVRDGKDGQDGKDGKSALLSTEKILDSDGKEIGLSIKITHPDGSTETHTIYHGRDGKDGQDGKTPQIRTEKGKDSQENVGRWLIIEDGHGNETVREFIRDGQDGKTPSAKVEPGKNEHGDSGQWIIIFDGDGNEVSREFVRDGKDGQDGRSPSLETVPGKNADGDSGLWVIVKDPQGKESSRHFIRDGKDGRGIKKIYSKDGRLTIVFTDNTKEILEIPCCQPKLEEPKPEEPKPEDPKPEDPKPEEPKPEDPKPEDPKPEDPKTEDPKPEYPKPEDPKPEEPKPENPKAKIPNAKNKELEEEKNKNSNVRTTLITSQASDQAKEKALAKAYKAKAQLPQTGTVTNVSNAAIAASLLLGVGGLVLSQKKKK